MGLSTIGPAPYNPKPKQESTETEKPRTPLSEESGSDEE